MESLYMALSVFTCKRHVRDEHTHVTFHPTGGFRARSSVLFVLLTLRRLSDKRDWLYTSQLARWHHVCSHAVQRTDQSGPTIKSVSAQKLKIKIPIHCTPKWKFTAYVPPLFEFQDHHLTKLLPATQAQEMVSLKTIIILTALSYACAYKEGQ